MGNKMLIDAGHPEETRVVVARNNNRIEELDYEAAARKQLRGNIYLAKVTRVEPSLQAAFVDYGGNRHGFLAFNEIHPDYYQIPIADRQALLEQEAADDRADEESDEGEERPAKRRKKAAAQKAEADQSVSEEVVAATPEDAEQTEAAADGDDDSDDGEAGADGAAVEAAAADDNGSDENGTDDDDDAESSDSADDQVESVGAGDAMEDVPVRKVPRRRAYKIQEVIKRRQIILVQVVKEERGNKGAALTTYLSLAGRYCVLMPNTARGGGISRKITDAQDRKRLKDVAKSAEVPEGMGLIVRTAGAQRTKVEVKRDFDYLLRLWENVRDLTLESSAPCLVYEEGSLIKRAIRDLYTKDIDSIIVEGEEGYKEAKDFMRMLMPSHARNIKLHKDAQPLFMRYSIENQLDVLFSPYVNLPSGGYIVINQTEALVAVDVNSGKSTREHNIEDTALKTNMEAAEEVARQMRLRDLAGLIVIDFIDMEERRNNRSVERRLKERLKSDRARIQVGRISHFGLLEMSRQRMRSGVLESSTKQCPTCEGRGFVRSVQSASLQVLRGLEDYLQRKTAEDLILLAPRQVALYILNQKRDHILQIEAAAGISVFVEADDSLLNSEFSIERASGRGDDSEGSSTVIQVDSPFSGAGDGDSEEDSEGRSKKRRRKRGRRGSRSNRRDEERPAAAAEAEDGEEASADSAEDARSASQDEEPGEGAPRERKSKRGSRGGRRRKPRGARAQAEDSASEETASQDAPARTNGAAEGPGDTEPSSDPEATTAADGAEDAEPAPKPKRRSRTRTPKRDAAAVEADSTPQTSEAPAEAATDAAAGDQTSAVEASRSAGNGHDAGQDSEATQSAPAFDADHSITASASEERPELPEPAAVEEEPSKPPRRGWWQRR